MKSHATPDERKQYVLDQLADAGRLTTSDHSTHFQVSEDSSRRDFRELAADGLIQRVHGAALPVSPATFSFASRRKISSSAKTRLARRAAERVLAGQVLLFDGGTTNVEIARHLPRTIPLTIVTNSPPLAMAMADHALAEIILLGGVLDRHSQMTVGARVLGAVADINADIFFLGIHGIDAGFGLSAAGYDEALIKLAMIDCASEVVAAATADKVGTAAKCKIGPVDLITTLITEKKTKMSRVQDFEKSGIAIELA